MNNSCSSCLRNTQVVSAIMNGVYYRGICRLCLRGRQSDSSFSSGYQRHDRNRQWEDYAQDTVQPYDASGNPNPEFYRLYPDRASLTLTEDEIKVVKKQI